MSKTTRKLRPSNYWRIGEHESWFSDMAAEGLHLKKVGLLFAQFVKGEPKKMRYRIEVSLNKEISPQVYAESGWDHVASYGLNVFSSPAELNAPELHTDPAEQSFTLKKLYNKLAVAAFIGVLGMIFNIYMFFNTLYLNNTPTLALIEGDTTLAGMSMFLLFVTYTSIRGAISIGSLRKNLDQGIPIDHNAPWKKQQRLNASKIIIFIVIVTFVLTIPYVKIFIGQNKNLPAVSTNLPIVRLADIEQNPDLEYSSFMVVDDVNYDKKYNYDWSLLAPEQYQSNERGMVSNEMWADGSGVYSPSISTGVYRLRLLSMADRLISDLIKRYEFLGNKTEDFIHIEHDDFDTLIIYDVKEYKQVFASKGKAVMDVRYYGHADLDTVIESVAQKISLISK